MNDFHEHVGNCSLSTVDFFGEHNQQTEVIDYDEEFVNPINSLDGTRVIEFVVKGNDDYIDLQNCYLQLKVKILHDDDKPLEPTKKISCINYPIATLFEHVNVYLNNDPATNSDNYAFKAYLETLLTYSGEAKKSWLQCGGFYSDTHKQMDTIGNANLGFKARHDLLEESRTVELIGKIHSGLFNQPLLLLNHVDMRIEFTRYRDDFCILGAAAEKPKIVIVDASLKIRRNTLANHKTNSVESLLQKQDIRYFIPHSVVKTQTFPQGLLNINVRNLITGRNIPNTIIVGMISNSAYNGDLALNPFNFEHYDISSADITVDSKSVFGKPLTADVDSEQFLDFYWSLQRTLGNNFRDDGFAISREQYLDGNFLFGHNLTSTMCNDQYEDPLMTGNMEINLKFAKSLPNVITVVVYMEFSNTISINASRRAVRDFV
jgi:hypothetical protein